MSEQMTREEWLEQLDKWDACPNVIGLTYIEQKDLFALARQWLELREARETSQVDSLVAAIEGDYTKMAHADLVLTCRMLERGRAAWRKDAEQLTSDLSSTKAKLQQLETAKGCVQNSESCAQSAVQNFIDAHHNPVVRLLNEKIKQLETEIEGLRSVLRNLVEAIDSKQNDGIVLSEIQSSWQVRDARTAAMKETK